MVSGRIDSPRRVSGPFARLIGGLALLLSVGVHAQSPTVNGSFFCSGDYQYYTHFNTSYLGSPLYISIVDDTLYVALVVNSMLVNDNTYDRHGGQGDTPYMRSAHWGGMHRGMRRAIDSEFAEFELTIGKQTWSWRQGYAGQVDQRGNFYDGNDVNRTNAGGRTWISGVEVAGGVESSELPPGLTMASSLAWNMNNYAASLPQNGGAGPLWDMVIGNQDNASNWKSPFLVSAPDDVTQVDGYPTSGQATCSTQFNWEWAMVYEFSVDLSGFGPNPIFVLNGNSHHSPIKSDEAAECNQLDDCFPPPADPVLSDWGDLPAPYPTLRMDDGARHIILANSAYLGAVGPDPEPDGQPHPAALGDDLAGANDEDGIRLMTPQWVAGDEAVFEVTIGRPGYLSGFIDFNGDGTLTQANVLEANGPIRVATGLLGDTYFGAAGLYHLTVEMPANTGDVLATRWRITNQSGQGGNSITGRADSGEVEDHLFRRMEILDVDVECGFGPNNNPVAITAWVNGVSEVEVFYWQEGVDTSWNSALAWDTTTNPMTQNHAGPDQFFNEWSMGWNTLGFDFNQGQVFQLRLVGRDSFGNTVTETVTQYNVATCDSTGVPVTVSSFDSQVRGRQLLIDWTTSSETGNVGFNLYGENARGEWQPLTGEMQLSHVVDSAEPQYYSFRGDANGVQRLFLEDVDIFGHTQLHGPFKVGQPYGVLPQPEPIDWADIRSQRDLSRAASRSRGWRHQERDPVRMLVSSNGVYRLSYEDALGAGMDLAGVPVSHLAVTSQGRPVPFYTEARGRFGPGDIIEFYGQAHSTLYTDTNVYLLEVDNRYGQRMSEGPGPAGFGRSQPIETYRETVSVRRQREYLASSYIETPWFDTRMQATGSPREWHFEFEVDAMVGSQATLRLDYWGISRFDAFDPDHHVEIYFNGMLLHDDWFNGRLRRQPEIAIPSRLLREGGNTLTVRLPADTGAPADLIAFSGFEVEYERRLEVRADNLRFSGQGGAYRVRGLTTDQPVVYRIAGDDVTRIRRVQVVEAEDGHEAWFQGARGEAIYVVADANQLPVPTLETGWSNVDITSGRADYLMISHPAFIDGLAPLVNYHQAQRRQVRVVDVNDIYDQFGHGIFDAAAIQAYIRATARTMGYEYVLLVGGDTFDYTNNLPTNSYSFIPSLYTATDNMVRFAPADALYVDLSGDGVPELPIGRLPVRTEAELAEVISKTLGYVGRHYTGTAVLAADHEEPGVSFREQLDRLAENGLAAWDVRRAYLDELSVAEARTELFGAINQGASLTAYFGHSAHTAWTFSGLFNSADVANLSNHGKPTAVAQWGCWNTYHVSPTYNTLGHNFMLVPDRGAAVVLGSATFSHVHSGRQLGERLIPLLTTPGLSVGQALTQAKQDLARNQPHMRDAILGWTILGDPALVISD